MSRPVDWSPLSDRDPVPGDADELARAARHYADVATAIDDASAKLRTLTAGLSAESEAVDAFRGSAEEVAGDISRAYQRYAGVAQALAEYVPELAWAQDRSITLLRAVQMADARQQDAQRLATAAAERAATAPPGFAEPERTEERRQAALAEEASLEVIRARKELEEVKADRDRARSRAIERIRDVHGSGGLKDGWRDNFGGFVNKSIAPLLPALNKLAAGVGFAALALAWVPFLGPALGTAALVLTGLSLLANLAMGVGKESGWGPAVVSALGMATFGLSKIASARYLAKAAGARAASRNVAGRWAASSPASRALAGLPTDPNSSRAIAKMMGPGAAFTRRQADRVAQQAADDTWRAASGRTLPDLPRQAWDDLKNIRNMDVRNPLQGARFDARALLGDRAMGPAAREVTTIHQVIRNAPSVAPLIGDMNRAGLVFDGAAGLGAGFWAYETYTLDHPEPASDRLNLAEHGPLAPSGR